VAVDVDKTFYKISKQDPCVESNNFITYTTHPRGQTRAFEVLDSIIWQLKVNSRDYDLQTMLNNVRINTSLNMIKITNEFVTMVTG
jgi:hypothetical protein